MTVQAPWDVPKNESSAMKYIVAAIVGLIGIAVIGFIILSTGNDDDDDVAADSERSSENEATSTSCRYDDEACFPTWFGLEQDATEDGIPTLGRADAPIIIGEFSDFACSHCANYESTIQNIANDYVRDGEVQLHYFPMTFVAGEFSDTAARAAICLIEQDAFWQFSQVLFEIQVEESVGNFTTDYLVRRADRMGLDGGSLRDCLLSDRPTTALRSAEILQRQLGVTGTPSVAYSLDGGDSWVLLDDRSESGVRFIIESNIVNGEHDESADAQDDVSEEADSHDEAESDEGEDHAEDSDTEGEG